MFQGEASDGASPLKSQLVEFMMDLHYRSLEESEASVGASP